MLFDSLLFGGSCLSSLFSRLHSNAAHKHKTAPAGYVATLIKQAESGDAKAQSNLA